MTFRRLAFGVCLLGCALPSLAQTPPETTVISSGTHLVVLKVVVKDKHGKPAEGLPRDDFVLRDNGHEQKIAMFALDDSRQPAGAQASAPLTFTNRPTA